jgi:arylsulfatase
MIFSADETADVGIDLATPVVEAIGAQARSKFTGRIRKVTIELKEMRSADRQEEEKAQVEVARKKVLAD